MKRLCILLIVFQASMAGAVESPAPVVTQDWLARCVEITRTFAYTPDERYEQALDKRDRALAELDLTPAQRDECLGQFWREESYRR